MSVLVDIGHGVEIDLRWLPDQDHADRPEGLDYWHACHGKRRVGWIPLNSPKGWTLEKREPLTISPSLLCQVCGHHGFIREGKWVPA